jgi:lipid A 3-O-deacylase
MPSILLPQQGTANKNIIYHGAILFLAVLLAMLRLGSASALQPPLEAKAQEVSSTVPSYLFPLLFQQETSEPQQQKDLQNSTNPTNPPPAPQSSPKQQEKRDSPNIVAPSATTFGTKGQKHWYIQGAAATTLDREEAFPQRFVLAGAGLSKFLFDGHSINLELNSIYFSQPDDDALGLNLSLLMRWHFLRKTNWSIFVDGGAGVMGTTSDVPSRGASFNFTPQAGAGVSIKLKEQKQLMLGLRWHHISHADLFGANPGRDSLMGYVGVQFPR